MALHGSIQKQTETEKGRSADGPSESAELKRLTDEVERLKADLTQFAYVASHDMKEPLRMVMSYLQLLQRRYGERLDPCADEFIEFAVEGSRRMLAMVDNLAVFARIETHECQVESVEFEAALASALENLAERVKQMRVQVTHDPLPEVHIESAYAVTLLKHLLENAIKFHGAEDPKIHVSVQREAEEWCFCIADNGIGIDPRFAVRVFSLFQRLNSRSAYSGTGMGLAICKKIVETHRGRIWLTSDPGRGTRFYFTLPAAGREGGEVG